MARIGIKDIAAKAGVSIATVSHAFRNPGRVSDATREKVLAAAKEVGYTPNVHAVSPRTAKSGAIVVIMPDVADSYNANIIKGIESIAGRLRDILIRQFAAPAELACTFLTIAAVGFARSELQQNEDQAAVDNDDLSHQSVNQCARVLELQVDAQIFVDKRGDQGKQQHRNRAKQLGPMPPKEVQDRRVLDDAEQGHGVQTPMLIPRSRATMPKPFQPMPDQISFSFSATRYSRSS